MVNRQRSFLQISKEYSFPKDRYRFANEERKKIFYNSLNSKKKRAEQGEKKCFLKKRLIR